MFYFVDVSSAAKMFHSKNIDELMEASADGGAAEQQAARDRNVANQEASNTSADRHKPRKHANRAAAKSRLANQVPKPTAVKNVQEATR